MVLTVGFPSSVPNISQLSLVVEFLVFRLCRIGDKAGLCLLSSQWPEGRTFHPCSVCFLLPFFKKNKKKKKFWFIYLFLFLGMILHLFRICHQDGLKEFLGNVESVIS